MRLLSAILLMSLSALPVKAEQWISLSDNRDMIFELDRDSITNSNHVRFARMRVWSRDGQRVALMISNLSVHCGQSYIQVESGQMGFKGERMIPFKGEDLDRQNRIIIIPGPNDAFNNLYKYVC